MKKILLIFFLWITLFECFLSYSVQAEVKEKEVCGIRFSDNKIYDVSKSPYFSEAVQIPGATAKIVDKDGNVIQYDFNGIHYSIYDTFPVFNNLQIFRYDGDTVNHPEMPRKVDERSFAKYTIPAGWYFDEAASKGESICPGLKDSKMIYTDPEGYTGILSIDTDTKPWYGWDRYELKHNGSFPTNPSVGDIWDIGTDTDVGIYSGKISKTIPDGQLQAHVLLNGDDADKTVKVGDSVNITGRVDNPSNIIYTATWTPDDTAAILYDTVNPDNTVVGGSRTFTATDNGKVYTYTITATSTTDPTITSTASHKITVTDGTSPPPVIKATVIKAHILANGTEGNITVKVGQFANITGMVDARLGFKSTWWSDKDSASAAKFSKAITPANPYIISNDPLLCRSIVEGGNTMKLTATGTYTYKITATDADDPTVTDTASLTITVIPNNPPKAYVNAPSPVYVGDIVPVKGDGQDPDDGDTEKLIYTWTITPKSDVEGTLSGKGSDLVFDKTGTYTVSLTVTDPGGLSDTAKTDIVVLEPMPKVNIIQTGTTKENRKIIIDASSSTPSESGLPNKLYSIDWSKATWNVKALSGGSDNDIKLQTHTEGSTNGTILYDSDRGVSDLVNALNGQNIFDMQCTKAGTYQLTATLTNTFGKSSTNTITITVVVDKPPIGVISVPTTVVRDPGDLDENGLPLATIIATDYSYSEDSDIIGKRAYFMVFDSNNDGNYDDEQCYVYDLDYPSNYHFRPICLYRDVKAVDINSINTGNATSVTYKTNYVGNRMFFEIVQEYPGQQFIPQFLDNIHKLLGDTNKALNGVINTAPTAAASSTAITHSETKKIDINLLTDMAGGNTDTINSKLNQFKSDMFAKGFDVNFNVTDGSSNGVICKYAPNPRVATPWYYYAGPPPSGSPSGVYKEPFTTENLYPYVKTDAFLTHYGSGVYDDPNDSKDTSGYATIVFDGIAPPDGYANLYIYWMYKSDENGTYTPDSFGGTSIPNDNKMHTMYLQVKASYLAPDWGGDSDRYSILTSVKKGSISNIRVYKGLYQESVYGSALPTGMALRDGSDRYFININNGQGDDFSKGSGNYFSLGGLSKSYLNYLNPNNYSVRSITFSANLNYILPQSTIQDETILQMINGSNDGRFYDTTSSSWDTQLDVLLNDLRAKYIISSDTYTGQPILVNEDILTINKSYNDYEKDSSSHNTAYRERWKYSQDPNVFKNNQGEIDNNNKWSDAVPYTSNTDTKIFNKVGQYIISYQAGDNPTAFKDNSAFDNYKLFSNGENQIKVLVHRRPIAQFYYTLSGTSLSFTNKSYDLDHCDLDNITGDISSGVVESRWTYKHPTDATWSYGMPASIGAGETYIVALEVKDPEGAWSHPYTQLITQAAIANVTVRYIDENTGKNIAAPIIYANELLGNNTYPKAGTAPNKINLDANEYSLDDVNTKTINVVQGNQEVIFKYKQIYRQSVVMVRYIDEDNGVNIAASNLYVETLAGNVIYPKEGTAPGTIVFSGINYNLDDTNTKTLTIVLGTNYDVYFKYKKAADPIKPTPSGGAGTGGIIVFNPDKTAWTNYNKPNGYPVTATITKPVVDHTWVQSYIRTTTVDSWTSEYHAAYGGKAEYWDEPVHTTKTINETIYAPFGVQYVAGSITITNGANPSVVPSGGTTYIPEGRGRDITGSAAYKQVIGSAITPSVNPSVTIGDSHNGSSSTSMVNISAVDTAEAPKNPTGAAGEYNIDYTDPTLSVEAPTADWYNTAINVNIGADDQSWLSELKEAFYHVFDSSHYGNNASGSYMYNSSIPLNDGIYSISLDDEDNATNTNSMQSKIFRVDAEAPQAAFSVKDGIFNKDNGAEGVDIIDGENNIKDFKYFGSLILQDNLSGVNKSSMQYLWTFGAPSEKGVFITIDPEDSDKNSHSSVDYTNREDTLGTDRYGERIVVRMEKPVGDAAYLNVKMKDVAGNYTYKSFGPFDDPIALRDFQVIDVRDRNWSEVFWKNNFDTHTGLNFPASKLPIDKGSNPIYKNADIKKGYAFYFDVTSEYLYRDEDKIVVTPSIYYFDGKKRMEVDMYYNNGNNPFTKMDSIYTKKGIAYDDFKFYIDYKDIFKYLTSAGRSIPDNMDENKQVSIGGFSKLNLSKEVRFVKGKEYSDWKGSVQYDNGKEQYWYGKYYIPATAIFVPKASSELMNPGLQPLDPKNQLNKNHIIINFQLTAYKNGLETSSENQTFNYVPDRWEKEGGPKNDKYKAGDIMVYDNENNLFKDYDTNITY